MDGAANVCRRQSAPSRASSLNPVTTRNERTSAIPRRAAGRPGDHGAEVGVHRTPPSADAAILPRQAAHHLRGTSRKFAVDENDFPGQPCERRLQLVKQLGDVVALVEGGDDDPKAEASPSMADPSLVVDLDLLWVFGARSDGFIHEGQRISAASRHAKDRCSRNTGRRSSCLNVGRPYVPFILLVARGWKT